MAFDAGMLRCVIDEIKNMSGGARVEKVFQPERDEIVLQIRSPEGGKRLLIRAGTSNPRIGFTAVQKENPMTPPMLCMLLRKHLQGAKLSDVRQAGFERVVFLEFEGRDEMGFAAKHYLIAEIMGKYSNLIFADEKMRIRAALRTVDLTTEADRCILPGMTYELPRKQDKLDPMTVTEPQFDALALGVEYESADKFILSSFLGISAAVAREIAYRAQKIGLKRAFFDLIGSLKENRYTPTVVLRDGSPVEYAFCELTHYGSDFVYKHYDSASLLLEEFFSARDREQHLRQKASDVLRILSAADSRIRRKLAAQRKELADCEQGSVYKKYADLITANLYCLKEGVREAALTDYEDWHEDGTYGTCTIPLDPRLSPTANAQSYYKKYAKSKSARVELTRQIELGEQELAYIDTVLDSLGRAETAQDLAEIREELYRSGYASRMKHYTASKKQHTPTVAKFRTSGGYTVLCGKNNVQNEYITHRVAGRNDYWFHVKNMPGSHAVMLCEGLAEPDVTDFTEAAEIAAYFSKGAEGRNVEVDYTLVRHVKKPAGGKPGFVIYHTNWSCIVTPNEEKVQSMRLK